MSLAFLGFIAWIIYLANTAQHSVFFELIASIPYGDKLGHFCLFGLLTLGANFAFKLKSFPLFSVKIYLGAIIVFVMVVSEELSQYFIPNRTLDAADLLADILGIITFSIITTLLSKVSLKK
jgi:VanZ family protein